MVENKIDENLSVEYGISSDISLWNLIILPREAAYCRKL